MIKAVIFDLDGVLRDSAKVNVGAARKTFAEFGIEINAEDKKIIVSRHPTDYIPLLKYAVDFDKYMPLNREKYFELLEDADLMDFAREALELMKKNKFKIALATASGKKGVYELFIEKFNLNGLFDVVVTFEDCKERKPHPEIYLTVLKKMNLAAEECVVVEDSDIGVESAKRAGIKCIAVPNEWTKDGDFSKADIIINSLKELNMELLEKL